jgi:hypothetical protein
VSSGHWCFSILTYKKLFDLFWWVFSKYRICIFFTNKQLKVVVLKIVHWRACNVQLSHLFWNRRGTDFYQIIIVLHWSLITCHLNSPMLLFTWHLTHHINIFKDIRKSRSTEGTYWKWFTKVCYPVQQDRVGKSKKLSSLFYSFDRDTN